jgi:hypothetical protein
MGAVMMGLIDGQMAFTAGALDGVRVGGIMAVAVTVGFAVGVKAVLDVELLVEADEV